jgi:hypothetical protein
VLPDKSAHPRSLAVGEADDGEEDDPRDDQDHPDGEHRAHAALGIPARRDGNPRAGTGQGWPGAPRKRSFYCSSGKYPNPIGFPTFSSHKVEIFASVAAGIVK